MQCFLLFIFISGYWSITVYGRKHCYRLYTKHFNEAVHWACAIQKIIDTKAPVETPTQLLIRDIEVGHKMHTYNKKQCINNIVINTCCTSICALPHMHKCIQTDKYDKMHCTVDGLKIMKSWRFHGYTFLPKWKSSKKGGTTIVSSTPPFRSCRQWHNFPYSQEVKYSFSCQVSKAARRYIGL